MTAWSFLTNHARVFVSVAKDPGARLKDIAEILGITERSAFAIVKDLTEAGYIVKEKSGGRNRYQIQHHLLVNEALIRELAVGEFLEALVGPTNQPA